MEYLIAVDDGDPLVQTYLCSLGAKPFCAGTWIALWNGVALSLCEKVHLYTTKRVVVCCLTTADWTYL
jgi:hypothetical protein